MRFRASAVLVAAINGAVVAAQTDMYRALGTNDVEASESIVNSFASGTIVLVGDTAIFKAATSDQRATLVRGAIAAVRTYTTTADFAERYARVRESHRPERPRVPQSGDEALAAQQHQLEAAIEQALKMSTGLSPDARERLDFNITQIKRQVAELHADPEHRATVDAAARESAREAEEDYKGLLSEFDGLYPADPRQLIAGRLRTFLDLSGTVDFAAAVEVRQDKKTHFVDLALEVKPAEWKLMYRAGKPAVDAARSAALAWLKAIGER